MSSPLKHLPSLDPEFVPAVVWNREYARDAAAAPESVGLTLGLLRGNTPVARWSRPILPGDPRTFRYAERHLKQLLWAFGGNQILFDGPTPLFEALKHYYREQPTGRFDASTIAEKMFGHPLTLERADSTDIPEPDTTEAALGRQLEGCRIGFDLGGSDRKCAAVIDGEVVYSEEIRWDPYFQEDPGYHEAGIQDSLQRAAAHLPRVDAIGGSAAGIYVDNEVRVASLFRGVPAERFDTEVRPLFKRLRERWGGIPFDVVNDGEVTALAGAMSLGEGGVLGISMGTSLAAGYVTPEGGITSRINELAFVPVDLRPDGPIDEWSGDRGCGVQYFSQQGVARLAPAAGLHYENDLPLAERLVDVQQQLKQGHPGARRLFDTLGTCFGYTIAHWAEMYDIRHLLILGRVTSGEGGERILRGAAAVLASAFPTLADAVTLRTPDETMKRHGQAVAAASLPRIPGASA